jgi:hypothetical protein
VYPTARSVSNENASSVSNMNRMATPYSLKATVCCYIERMPQRQD